MAQTLTTENGNSVYGRVKTAVTLVLFRYGRHYFEAKPRKNVNLTFARVVSV